MDRQTALDIISGRRGGLWAGLLRAALRGASVPYAAAMRLRRWGYRSGALRVRRVGVPVLCVGNITTGGTGKTPMTAWVVQRVRELGRTPAILTRGYKALAGRSDEVELLKALCGAAVYVNADRVAGAAAAVAGGADVLVMDDGFQHRRLVRDLDVVLLDAVNPFGFGWCLPGGLLRESPAALRQAGAIVVTHADEVAEEARRALRRRLAVLAPDATVHSAVHRPIRVIDEQGEAFPLHALAGRKVFAFCGLGAPEHFWTTLERCGARLAGRRAFEDHAAYTPEIAEGLRREARRCGARVCVTTQKDFVKLDGLWPPAGPVPLWQLAVEVEVVEGRRELLERIAAVVART